ncbi:MAG: hypothetical protein CMP66_03310 [Flavobacteriales bacterium]|nr:hypothetical protein [Flavobacteriales bacterium]|tara:strand:- start:521 stop:1054 length:534 start_codon:yes stop_codon:yes gene_type:complete
MKKQDQFYIPIIIILSIIIPLAVAALMFMPEDWHFDYGGADLRSLPFFHAVINGSTAVLLFTGFVLIKNKKINWHRICMIAAFLLSAIFLVSYVISKIVNPKHTGYEGEWGFIYYFILASHIVLSIPVLPLAMLAIYRGMTGEFQKHTKIVKWTFPIWMYVAVTGVLVYLFMIDYYA